MFSFLLISQPEVRKRPFFFYRVWTSLAPAPEDFYQKNLIKILVSKRPIHFQLSKSTCCAVVLADILTTFARYLSFGVSLIKFIIVAVFPVPLCPTSKNGILFDTQTLSHVEMYPVSFVETRISSTGLSIGIVISSVLVHGHQASTSSKR